MGCFPSFATTMNTVYSCLFQTLISVSSTLILRSHALLFLFQHHKSCMVFIYCLIFKIFFIYSLRILYKYAMNLVTLIIYSPIHLLKMFYHILLPTFLSFFLNLQSLINVASMSMVMEPWAIYNYVKLKKKSIHVPINCGILHVYPPIVNIANTHILTRICHF